MISPERIHAATVIFGDTNPLYAVFRVSGRVMTVLRIRRLRASLSYFIASCLRYSGDCPGKIISSSSRAYNFRRSGRRKTGRFASPRRPLFFPTGSSVSVRGLSGRSVTDVGEIPGRPGSVAGCPNNPPVGSFSGTADWDCVGFSGICSRYICGASSSSQSGVDPGKPAENFLQQVEPRLVPSGEDMRNSGWVDSECLRELARFQPFVFHQIEQFFPHRPNFLQK